MPSAAWLLVPIGFTVVAAVSFFGMILNDQLRRASGQANGQQAIAVTHRSPSLIRSLLVMPTDYGVLCLIFLLLGQPTAFFAAYTVLFAGSAGFLLACPPSSGSATCVRSTRPGPKGPRS